jgi:ABC-2 type transport system permease protein
MPHDTRKARAAAGDFGLSGLELYGRYLGVSLRAQLQYRASFVLQALGTALVTAAEFAVVLALFARFGSLQGWSLPEVALFYALVNIAWALAEAAWRGFDDFGALVKSGDFDRVMLRPRSTVLQVMGRELTLRRVGRLAQAGAVLAWSWWTLGLGADPAAWVLLATALAGAIALFGGLLILQATLAFWTVESLEVMNTMTYGGVTTAQYPLAIYPGWLRRLFTLVVPLGCVTYFPVVAILGRDDPLGMPRWGQWLSPLAGGVFLLASLRVWRLGLRRYASAGS